VEFSNFASLNTYESNIPLAAGTNSSDGMEWSSPPAATTPHSKLTLKYSELGTWTKENTVLGHIYLVTLIVMRQRFCAIQTGFECQQGQNRGYEFI